MKIETNKRPLHLDFGSCTDDDIPFKESLIRFLVKDLMEILQTMNTIQNGCAEFIRTRHKIATTIAILNDSELTEEMITLRNHYKKISTLSVLHEQQHLLKSQSLCQAVIESLQLEIDPII